MYLCLLSAAQGHYAFLSLLFFPGLPSFPWFQAQLRVPSWIAGYDPHAALLRLHVRVAHKDSLLCKCR